MENYADTVCLYDTQNEFARETEGENSDEDLSEKKLKELLGRGRLIDRLPPPEVPFATAGTIETIGSGSLDSEVDRESHLEGFEALQGADPEQLPKYYDFQINYGEDYDVVDALGKKDRTTPKKEIGQRLSTVGTMDLVGEPKTEDIEERKSTGMTPIASNPVFQDTLRKSGAILEDDLNVTPKEEPKRPERVQKISRPNKNEIPPILIVNEDFIACLSEKSSHINLTKKSQEPDPNLYSQIKEDRSRTDYDKLKRMSKEISLILMQATQRMLGKPVKCDEKLESKQKSVVEEEATIEKPHRKSIPESKPEKTKKDESSTGGSNFEFSFKVGSKMEVQISVEPDGETSVDDALEGMEFRIRDKTFRIGTVKGPCRVDKERIAKPHEADGNLTFLVPSRKDSIEIMKNKLYAKEHGEKSFQPQRFMFIKTPCTSRETIQTGRSEENLDAANEPITEIVYETYEYTVSNIDVLELKPSRIHEENTYVEYKSENEDITIERPHRKRLHLIIRMISPLKLIYNRFQKSFNLSKSYSQVFPKVPCWMTLNPFMCGSGLGSDATLSDLIRNIEEDLGTWERDPFQLYSNKSKFNFDKTCFTMKNKCKYCDRRCRKHRRKRSASSSQFSCSSNASVTNGEVKIRVLDNKLMPPIIDSNGKPVLILDASGKPLYTEHQKNKL